MRVEGLGITVLDNSDFEKTSAIHDVASTISVRFPTVAGIYLAENPSRVPRVPYENLRGPLECARVPRLTRNISLQRGPLSRKEGTTDMVLKTFMVKMAQDKSRILPHRSRGAGRRARARAARGASASRCARPWPLAAPPDEMSVCLSGTKCRSLS